jgi:hypothetical protein
MKEKIKTRGKVTATVYTKDGSIKRHSPGFFRRLFNIPGKEMISINHNIVTDEGDALIADLLAETPARNKLNNTNARIVVGTGWTGTNPKQNTWLNNQVGSAEQLDATYPKVKGAFGAADDNVIQYRATFEAGDLNATGINEAGLANATTSTGDLMAYAQITPAVNISLSDTLQIDWELTFLGS